MTCSSGWHGVAAARAHASRRRMTVAAKPARMEAGTPEAPAMSAEANLVIAPAFLRIRDVLRITSLSRPTLYRRIAARRFPAPVHLGGRACGWSSSALQAWINDPEGYCAPAPIGAAVIRKRGRPLKYPEFRGR